MFGQQTGYGGRAGAAYRAIDTEARVEAASPHRLVAILFEEIVVAIAAAAGAARAGDRSRRGEQQARALRLLQSLDAALDFERGGDIAPTLALVYAQARFLLLSGARENAPERFDKARALIAEIATAWEEIG